MTYRDEVLALARTIDKYCGADGIPCLAGIELLRFAEALQQRGLLNANEVGRRHSDQVTLATLTARIADLERENAGLRRLLQAHQNSVTWSQEVTEQLQSAYNTHGTGVFWDRCRMVLDSVVVGADGHAHLTHPGGQQ